MTIFYRLGDKIYINITNRCPCDCTFCIRRDGDSVNGKDSLWLNREPTLDEIKADFTKLDLADITEIVFCGYGEPTERADDVIAISEFIKSKVQIPLRLNTNGLVKLINPNFDLSRLKILDSVSISLNASNADDYQKLTRSKFGEVSFDELLDFAVKIKQYTLVCFSVVDVEGFDIKKCKQISNELQIELRIRSFGM